MNQNKNKKELNDQVDELVKYIDEFMSKENAGHMNIKVNQNGVVDKEEIFIDNTGNCASGACKAPTLFDGLDSNEEE